MLPVAEEYKKILLVEPAVADSITGDKWNKYIFRTGRNSSQDAIAERGRARQGRASSIATLAQDYAFGRDGVEGVQGGAGRRRPRPRSCTRNTCRRPPPTSPPRGQRLIDALKDKPGRKVIAVVWAGAAPAAQARRDLKPKRYGIEIATGGNILPAMAAYKQFPGMEGATYYYFGIPKNPVNDWLVAEHYKQFKARRRTSSPPAAWPPAMAIVEALKKTDGDTDTEKLIPAMEGMSFDTPKGKMTFRKEDHQAMQGMYHFTHQGRPGRSPGACRSWCARSSRKR